jgi:hypothetical protein
LRIGGTGHGNDGFARRLEGRRIQAPDRSFDLDDEFGFREGIRVVERRACEEDPPALRSLAFLRRTPREEDHRTGAVDRGHRHRRR